MTTYEGKLNGKGLKFALVVGRFNELISGRLLRGRPGLPAPPRRRRRRRRRRLGAGRVRDAAGGQEAGGERPLRRRASAWAP